MIRRTCTAGRLGKFLSSFGMRGKRVYLVLDNEYSKYGTVRLTTSIEINRDTVLIRPNKIVDTYQSKDMCNMYPISDLSKGEDNDND